MSLFALSDLHLSFDSDKSMEIFRGWENYTERIEKNWKRIVKPEDTVVLAGDISWAVGLSRAVRDFSFLNRLPGEKIILKGNHDFWWSTMAKMNAFLAENHFDTVRILHNNCCPAQGFAVCGTRGWLYDGSGEADERVLAREAGRLDASLAAAAETGLEPVVFLHYPPVYGDFVCTEILAVLRKYKINRVFYGHIHGAGRFQTVSAYEEFTFRLISCDCVGFTPVLIC